MLLSIKDELHKLKQQQISNEELYKLSELEETLQLITFDSFKCENIIITPYYVDSGKIYELYAYELSIQIVDRIDFDSYIRNITGKESVEDISDEIIELHKHCHIELTSNQPIKKKELEDYISYLQNFQQIREEIQKTFSIFDKNKLYFEIY